MKKYILSLMLAAMSTMAVAQNCEIQLMAAPVHQGDEVTEGFNDALMNRLSNLLAQKGVAASANFTQFFITGKFSHFYKETLPGPPMQTVMHSTLTLYIGDVINEQVYASETFEVRGVGNSLERALLNAMSQLNGKNQKIEALVDKGKKKILDFYNNNYQTLLQKAKIAAALNEYGEALYYFVSIPECCEGYAEAYTLMDQIFTEKLTRDGKQLIQLAQSVYYADPSAKGAAKAMQYLAMIDPSSPALPEAEKLAQEIKKNTKSDYDFENRQKYSDAIAIEKNRIEAARAVGVAWGNGQKAQTTNLMFVR